MRIHPEGKHFLRIIGAALLLMALAGFIVSLTAGLVVSLVAVGLFLFFLQFFRHPDRPIALADDQRLYAPADGKVVAVEETVETEYFQDQRLQISIFMSIFDLHVNRVPASGEVIYRKHHPGRYLVAWRPKSSTDNEMTTLVLRTPGGAEILLRQIAGALARRICTYPVAGSAVEQGDELGFIKFGSRVDLLLPIHATVEVEIGQHVRGNETVIARLGQVEKERSSKVEKWQG